MLSDVLLYYVPLLLHGLLLLQKFHKKLLEFIELWRSLDLRSKDEMG